MITRDCAIIFILMQRYRRGGRMTIKCSAAWEPGEASEGKRKVGIESVRFAREGMWSASPKEKHGFEGKGYALLEGVGGI